MSKSKKDRAKKLFHKPGGGKRAEVSQLEAERRVNAEKTARLRALRLARDEAEAKAKAEAKEQAKPVSARGRKS